MPATWEYRGDVLSVVAEGLEQGLRVIADAVANGASPRVGLLMRDTPRDLLEMLHGQGGQIAERTGIRFVPFRSEADAPAALQSGD